MALNPRRSRKCTFKICKNAPRGGDAKPSIIWPKRGSVYNVCNSCSRMELLLSADGARKSRSLRLVMVVWSEALWCQSGKDFYIQNPQARDWDTDKLIGSSRSVVAGACAANKDLRTSVQRRSRPAEYTRVVHFLGTACAQQRGGCILGCPARGACRRRTRKSISITDTGPDVVCKFGFVWRLSEKQSMAILTLTSSDAAYAASVHWLLRRRRTISQKWKV